MKLTLALIATLFSLQTFASSLVGVSVHPMKEGDKLIHPEFVNRFTSGSSQGLQVRYLHNFTDKLNADAGLRVFRRDISTFFASGTYELYPDYDSQPQIALKAFFERERNDTIDSNIFGIAPVVSKGYSFQGYPIYPYASLPLRMQLIDTEQYKIASALTLGLSAELPFQNFSNVLGNVELNIDIDNSYSYLALGLAMTFN